jgi:hypothetical protein
VAGHDLEDLDAAGQLDEEFLVALQVVDAAGVVPGEA